MTDLPEFKSTAWPSSPAVPAGKPDELTEPYKQPDPSKAPPPITEQEVKSRRASFIELIMRAVAQVVFGIFSPSLGTGLQQFQQWAAGIFETTRGFLHKVFLVGDIIEVFSQKEDGDLNDLGSVVNRLFSDAQETLDGLVRGFLGWRGSGYSTAEAKTAVADQAQTVAAFGALLAELKNRQDQQNSSGNAVTISFLDRPDADNLGSDFDQSYSGPGSNVLGIRNGRAVLIHSGWTATGYRKAVARYNELETLTDHQLIGVAFGSAPWYSSFEQGYNHIFGRMNDTETCFIQVRLGRREVELGCMVDGDFTVFQKVTTGFSFQANSFYWLQCGAQGGDRVFRVLDANLSAIITHTEVGTTSRLGPDYRGCGPGVATSTATGAVATPGAMLSFGFTDNTPAPTVGSYAKAFRASGPASGTSGGSGNRGLAANSFDTLDRKTSTIDWDAATNTFTVHRSGSYQFNWRAESPDADGVTPTARVNGGVVARGPKGANDVLGGSFTLYLEDGDEVSPGIHTAGSLSFSASGGAEGSEMFMTLAFIRSEPPPQ